MEFRRTNGLSLSFKISFLTYEKENNLITSSRLDSCRTDGGTEASSGANTPSNPLSPETLERVEELVVSTRPGSPSQVVVIAVIMIIFGHHGHHDHHGLPPRWYALDQDLLCRRNPCHQHQLF